MSTTTPSDKDKNSNINTITSAKRNLSPESIQSTQVKPKSYKMETIDEIKKLISNSTKNIEQKIGESQKCIEDKLTEFTSSVSLEVQSIKDSVNDFNRPLDQTSIQSKHIFKNIQSDWIIPRTT